MRIGQVGSIGRVGNTRGTGVGLMSAFGRAKSLMASGVDVTILVVGDSTGNDTGEWVDLFVRWLATQYTAQTVKYYLWGSTSYAAGVTVQTGASGTLSVYNASIAGATPVVLVGARWAAAVDTLPTPDLIIYNYGLNIRSTSYSEPQRRAYLIDGAEAIRLRFPSSPFVAVLQNPTRDDTDMASVYASERTVFAAYGDVITPDVYAAYSAAGKPSAWYVDNLHPSATGTQVWLGTVQAAWRAARAVAAPVAGPFLGSSTTNLLQNGKFANWTGAAPENWNAPSGMTCTKDTTYRWDGAAYSCKLTQSVANKVLSQSLTAQNIALIAGGTVTVAAALYLPTVTNSSCGRIGIDVYAASHGGWRSYNMYAPAIDGGRWMWTTVPACPVPSDATTVQVSLWCDQSNAADSVAYWGEAILVPGDVPRRAA